AGGLDQSVRTLGEFQHLWQFGPRLRRGGRDAGLHDAEVVDDESRVGVAIDQGGARLQVAPAQDIDRKVVANGGAQDRVEARVVRLALRLLRQHDADADRAGRILPVGDHVGHRRIVCVDRLNNGKPAGMGPLHFDRIAGIVAVQGEGGDEDCAVDADFVHRGHHLVTRGVIGPVRYAVPGSLRGVGLIGMDLRIADSHRREARLVPREFAIAAGPCPASRPGVAGCETRRLAYDDYEATHRPRRPSIGYVANWTIGPEPHRVARGSSVTANVSNLTRKLLARMTSLTNSRLAAQTVMHHIESIELRPNDLASARMPRRTDDF